MHKTFCCFLSTSPLWNHLASVKWKLQIYCNVCVRLAPKKPHIRRPTPQYSEPSSVNRVKYSLWLGNGLWELECSHGDGESSAVAAAWRV